MKNKNKETKKKGKKAEAEAEEEESAGTSLDDAFADDEDVEYAKPKPAKLKKKGKGMSEDEIEEELGVIENTLESTKNEGYTIKASKPISKVKKGDKIRVDGKEYEVDSHYVLIDHGTTKEMVVELFDPKTDKDYQLRYFNDQAESTLEFYELQEIIYIKKAFSKVEW